MTSSAACDDEPGLVLGQEAQLEVHERRGLLEDAERVDQLARHPVVADREVVEGALGLGAPVAVGGDVDGAVTVRFTPHRARHARSIVITSMAGGILDGLNDRQREAVTHDTGPLLIVAGAGTGKTTVITRRIAHLIAQGKARPGEILALTFTDKAAAEMEERVDQLVPYGYADVDIATFHSFGDRMLREYALELGLTPDFSVLSRAEQVIFLRDRLFELPLARYRPLGDPTRHLQALITLVSRCKDEDIAPEAYAAAAERLRAAAAAAPDDAELADRAAQQAELAATYARYQALMAREAPSTSATRSSTGCACCARARTCWPPTSAATSTSSSTSSRTPTTPSSSWSSSWPPATTISASSRTTTSAYRPAPWSPTRWPAGRSIHRTRPDGTAAVGKGFLGTSVVTRHVQATQARAILSVRAGIRNGVSLSAATTSVLLDCRGT